MIYQYPRRCGLTLLETLVALTILAAGIVGITSGISHSSRLATSSIRLQDAALTARNQLATAVAEAESLPVSSQGEHGLYTWELSFESKDHRLILATVRVSWLDRGVPRQMSLSEVYLPREVLAGEEGGS